VELEHRSIYQSRFKKTSYYKVWYITQNVSRLKFGDITLPIKIYRLYIMTSRVRREHLAMADSRAMEEQMERENPVNEKTLLEDRSHMEQTRRLSGQGHCGGSATPSMGLSMYRGGGTKKGQMRLTARRAYEPPSEAHEMGRHLGLHLHQLHGGAFHKEFAEGLHGAGFFDSIKRGFENTFDPNKNGVSNLANKVKNEFVNPNSVLRHDIAPKVANEFTDPNSVLRGKVIPIGAQVAQYASPFIDAVVPGAGTAINYGFKAANYANKGAKMLGYGDEQMRAKQMLGQNKKGRARNNGPPLLSGNVNGNVSGGMVHPRTGRKMPSPMTSSNPLRLKGGQVRRMVGSGTGAGMLEEPMPMPGNNLNLSGGADTGAYEGQGKGRSARASIVKRVMAEKGLKMIEASKYVKAHNLY